MSVTLSAPCIVERVSLQFQDNPFRLRGQGPDYFNMTIFYARGSPEEVITPRDAKEALDVVFEKLGKRCDVCVCVARSD